MVRPTNRQGFFPPLTSSYAEAVLAFVSQLFNYSQGSLLSKARDQDRALIRQLVIWLLAETTDASLSDFAQVTGRSDHRTATQAIEKIGRLQMTEFGFRLLTRRLLDRAAKDNFPVPGEVTEGRSDGDDPPCADAIVRDMACAFGYSKDDLITLPDHDCGLIRQLVIWLAREASGASQEEIAQIIGSEDNMVVFKAIESIDKLRRSERGFRSLTRRLLERAKAAPAKH